jgi:hypothetical protein
MNGCRDVQSGFTEYLDGRLNGHEMQRIAAHLDGCRECAKEWKSLRAVHASLAGLGPAPEPEDLPLRLRVAISQERARSRRPQLEAWGMAWKNCVGPFLLQASAGFASAVLLLGSVVLMVSMFAQPERVQAVKDQPLGVATAPRLLYLSSAVGGNDLSTTGDPVVVEAYVNGQGQVYDYRIVSGPTDEATRGQLENLLLFSVFEPAKFFGKPVRGLAVISFAGVSVRG